MAARLEQRLTLAPNGVSFAINRWLTDGFRESEQSWKDVLVDMTRRDPQLAIGDGALGFWKALPQAFWLDP